MDCADFIFHLFDTTAYYVAATGACAAAVFAYRTFKAQEQQVFTQQEQLAILKDERAQSQKQFALVQAQATEEKSQMEAAVRARTPIFDLIDTFPDRGVHGLRHEDSLYRYQDFVGVVVARIGAELGTDNFHKQVVLRNLLPHTAFYMTTVEWPDAPAGVTGDQKLQSWDYDTGIEGNRRGKVYTLTISFPGVAYTERWAVLVRLTFQTAGGDRIQQTYRYKIGGDRFDLVQ